MHARNNSQAWAEKAKITKLLLDQQKSDPQSCEATSLLLVKGPKVPIEISKKCLAGLFAFEKRNKAI
ncbi:hypothetical protein BPAE_0010g00800 [Botrytis paeoniae]|uniref:Uncharacterized protein n=1 Tax=Botrytis paeoniae TaxID=278948 RepID=A0A4Z1FYL1_9HELO|nr:hypothetical protein BPAE_0010g00800 [Botrytis paeoniae]